MAIQTRHDQKRGCGWRKGGGLYLVADAPSMPCGKLPVVLDVCPTCHGGIKPTRSWTWIDADAVMRDAVCAGGHCEFCPLSRSLGMAGLLWVGGKFYPIPQDWTLEAMRQGVSRRIPALPRNFKLGETWVLVAHREAIPKGDGEFSAAIFHAFKPKSVEYVVKGTETAEEIEALEKRGITPVRIERITEATEQPELVEA